MGGMLLTEGASTALDLTNVFTTSLTGIQTDFVKYAAIAIPIGIAIWSAPKVVKLVMKFFNALTH